VGHGPKAITGLTGPETVVEIGFIWLLGCREFTNKGQTFSAMLNHPTLHLEETMKPGLQCLPVGRRLCGCTPGYKAANS
jgi:hypothetical protein